MAILGKRNRFPIGLRSMVKGKTVKSREIVFTYHGRTRAGEVIDFGTTVENGDFVKVADQNGEIKSFSLKKMSMTVILPK